MHRTLTFVSIALAASLAVACTADTRSYRNALTNEPCEPNDTLLEAPAPDADRPGNGNQSPTGIPGDNLDDLRSGKVDCLYDGNSGQGDDKKHGCEGCDDSLCCDESVLPPSADDGDEGDGDDGDDGAPDDGAPDDGAPDDGAPDEGAPDEGAPDESSDDPEPIVL